MHKTLFSHLDLNINELEVARYKKTHHAFFKSKIWLLAIHWFCPVFKFRQKYNWELKKKKKEHENHEWEILQVTKLMTIWALLWVNSSICAAFSMWKGKHLGGYLILDQTGFLLQFFEKT